MKADWSGLLAELIAVDKMLLEITVNLNERLKVLERSLAELESKHARLDRTTEKLRPL